MKLTRDDKRDIERAIAEAEALGSGEIRVHVKGRCGEDVMGEAGKVFRRLGMHRTREKNGILIFAALDSRRFAILGDEGIYRRSAGDFWTKTRDIMQAQFSSGSLKEAILEGVRAAGAELARHFPPGSSGRDELSDQVTED